MYEESGCYALCVAMTRLAWRDLRKGDPFAGEFLLHGWVARAMDIDASKIEERVFAALKAALHDEDTGGNPHLVFRN